MKPLMLVLILLLMLGSPVGAAVKHVMPPTGTAMQHMSGDHSTMSASHDCCDPSPASTPSCCDTASQPCSGDCCDCSSLYFTGLMTRVLIAPNPELDTYIVPVTALVSAPQSPRLRPPITA